MKKSISNIAWDIKWDARVAEIIYASNFSGIDIAPSKYWNEPLDSSITQVKRLKGKWSNKGLEIVALQSLMFNHPEFQIFGNEKQRKKAKKYLIAMADLASKLGAKKLIFGSPKNRRIDNYKEAYSYSIKLFNEIGDICFRNKLVFCIEPNPAEYGCNFINTHKEAVELVKRVKSKGFLVNIDTSTMLLNNEPIEKTLSDSLEYAGHIHISEPYIKEMIDGRLNHKLIRKVLEENNYIGWITFEIGRLKSFNSLSKNVEYLNNFYE